MIFKMRIRITNVKMYQQNKYENHECEACGETNETQEHILNCTEILNIQNDGEKSEFPRYEKIANGSVKDQIEIAKSFMKQIKVIEKLRRQNK